MDLYKEISDNMCIVKTPSCHDIYQKCYEILSEIVDVIKDETLSDPECFQRIETIVSILNKNGIDTDGRHDFG